MPTRCIEPATTRIDATMSAVPSKSATHRALVAAALACGTSEIRNFLDSDDTRRTLAGLSSLGVGVEETGGVLRVHGACGEIPGGGGIDCGASGTTARFLTALAATGARPTRIDGDARLRERPMAELVRALETLHAAIRREDGDGLPLVAGGSRVTGGEITLSGERSSQFASALLLAGAAFERGLTLRVAPPRVSYAYVTMTVDMLRAFGASIEVVGDERFSIAPQRLRSGAVTIEGDHSSASYWLTAAAVLGGRVRIEGLSAESAQPDARLARELGSLGCGVRREDTAVAVEAPGRIPGFAWDLSASPDLAPAAAVLALFAEGPTTLSGVAHLRWKESDRLAAIAENLERLGASVAIENDAARIEPPPRGAARGATIATHGDHRIAMAFAIAGLAIPGVVIDDDGVVAKSYPGFWRDLDRFVRTGSSGRD